MSYHVDIVPNQTDKPAILFRQAWREGKRVRRKTLANLSRMPSEFVDALRALLKGAVIHPGIDTLFSIRRALPHGHVAAALGICRRLGLPRLLHRRSSRQRDLALAAIVLRILSPASKLACARQLCPETAGHTLGALLGTGPVRGNEMLDMLDWLGERQKWIEQGLARRHLDGGALILYDVSSSYLEGKCCPLAAFGYNRDGKRGKRQIVYGLLCSAEGCPVAVEVFDGNTGDPTTVGAQVDRIRRRFGIDRVALVGDRGMLTTARIREDLKPAGLDWVSALKSAHIRKLAQNHGSEGLDPGNEAPCLLFSLFFILTYQIDFHLDRFVVPVINQDGAQPMVAFLRPCLLRLPGNSRLAKGSGHSGSPRRLLVAEDTLSAKACSNRVSSSLGFDASAKCINVLLRTESVLIQCPPL